MPYVAVVDAVIGQPVKAEKANALIDNQAFFNSVISLKGTPLNGSFEFPVGAGEDPDEWTKVEAGSGTGEITVTEADVFNGKQAYVANVSMDGDTVTLTTDSYTFCDPGQVIETEFWYKFENATMSLKVELFWYYWTGSAWSAATTASSTTFSIATGAVTWTPSRTTVSVPGSGAHLPEAYKVKITFGGTGGVATLYDTFMDAVATRVFRGTIWIDYAHASNPIATITTNTTTTVTLPSAILGFANPNAAIVFADRGGWTTDPYVEFGNTASEKYLIANTADYDQTAYQQVMVPLNAAFQFKVYTVNGVSVSTGTKIYLVGFIV
jgi:hypothetical protein